MRRRAACSDELTPMRARQSRKQHGIPRESLGEGSQSSHSCVQPHELRRHARTNHPQTVIQDACLDTIHAIELRSNIHGSCCWRANPVRILQVAEQGEVTISTNEIGKWKFLVFGVGIPPTKFEPQLISVGLNKDFSTTVHFKNPFKETINVTVSLEAKVSMQAGDRAMNE